MSASIYSALRHQPARTRRAFLFPAPFRRFVNAESSRASGRCRCRAACGEDYALLASSRAQECSCVGRASEDRFATEVGQGDCAYDRRLPSPVKPVERPSACRQSHGDGRLVCAIGPLRRVFCFSSTSTDTPQSPPVRRWHKPVIVGGEPAARLCWPVRVCFPRQGHVRRG